MKSPPNATIFRAIFIFLIKDRDMLIFFDWQVPREANERFFLNATIHLLSPRNHSGVADRRERGDGGEHAGVLEMEDQ